MNELIPKRVTRAKKFILVRVIEKKMRYTSLHCIGFSWQQVSELPLQLLIFLYIAYITVLYLPYCSQCSKEPWFH